MMGRPAELPQVLQLPIVRGRCYSAGNLVPLEAPSEGRPSRDIAQAAHLRGTIAARPCSCCRGSRKRRFKECVALEGRMKGRCTNCHWAMDQRKCIFPTTLQGEPQAPARVSAPDQLPTTTMSYPAPSAVSPAPANQLFPSAAAVQQARWSDDPTIQDLELIRAAVSMPPMQSNPIPRVHLWLENDWRMDGLAALDPGAEDVDIEISCMSYSNPCYNRPHECDQMYVGSVVDLTGYLEELYIDTDFMSYQGERIARLQGRVEKLEKHEATAAELLGFVEELHLGGNDAQIRKQRKERVQMAIRKMKERVAAGKEEVASLHQYIQARAVELERWYSACDKYLGSAGEGKDQRRRILSEIERIPFALCTSPEERGAIRWQEMTRGPSVEGEDRRKRRRLAEVRSDLEKGDARAEQEKATMRRMLNRGR